MQIQWKKFSTNFQGDYCFVHTRGLVMPDGFGIMTAQPLRLSGSDIFYGMYLSKTADGGETWSALEPSKNLTRQDLGGGYQLAMSDATPMYHKKTGKILLMGHGVLYLNDELAPDPRRRNTVYSIYDPETGDFMPFHQIEMPQDAEETYFSCGNGSGQSLELENGELLIPVYFINKAGACTPWHSCGSAAVVRCTFDGETITVEEVGPSYTVTNPRGLDEPSIAACGGRYFLALRNDVTGYVARSTDGLHYEEPVELVFDDGQNAGNYNTQQHWLTSGGKLYLVYTRRGADNDHVFRHRAPLFVAEFDMERMCLIRATEQIAVPNRGARLGNFGCQSLDDGTGLVFASEWMQTIAPDHFNWRKCMEYGSDNSIFISRIRF